METLVLQSNCLISTWLKILCCFPSLHSKTTGLHMPRANDHTEYFWGIFFFHICVHRLEIFPIFCVNRRDAFPVWSTYNQTTLCFHWYEDIKTGNFLITFLTGWLLICNLLHFKSKNLPNTFAWWTRGRAAESDEERDRAAASCLNWITAQKEKKTCIMYMLKFLAEIQISSDS